MLRGDKYWFSYPLSVTLAGTLNIESQNTVQVQQDHDFELWQVQFVSTGNFSIILGSGTAGGAGVYFSTGYIRGTNICGTGVLPHRIPEPGRPVFPAASIIGVQLRNDTGSSNTVILCFEGVHIRK